MLGSERRSGMKGTVLIMILTVMFVLIIMLMATLTVVTTANQRVYTKYEENQAYYTARSALDVYTKQMMIDDKYYAYNSGGGIRQFSYTDNTVTPSVVNTAPMKQGLALQLDLYKIKSQAESATKDGYDLKWVENALPSDSVFASGSPEEANYIMDAASGGLPYIEYDVKLPAVSKGSDKYAKMVDTDLNDEDGDGDKTDQIARIKVEVLDRRYAMSPSVDDEVVNRVLAGTPVSGDPTAADIITYIQNGERSKDYMKIKVTSTVKLMDTEGVAVVIFETTEKENPATDNALTTMGGISGGGGAMVRVAGGASSLDTGTIKIGDGNNMSGSLFTLGKFEWTSSSQIKLNKNNYIVAMDGIAPSSNETNVTSDGDGAFMFLGGQSIVSQGSIGDSTHNIPVIAQKLIHSNSNPFNIYGNAYINTLEIQSGNPGKMTVTGNTYVKDLILPDSTDFFSVTYNESSVATGVTINETELNALKAKFCTGYSIKNASGTITISASGATVNGTPVTLGNTLDASGGSAFDMYNFTGVKDDNERIFKEYNIPFQINGENKVRVPTAQSNFGQFFKEGAFHDSTGELKNASNQLESDLTDPDNAYTTIYSDANKSSWLYNAGDILSDYLELPALPPGAASRNVEDIITLKSAPVLPSGTTIDLSAGDVFYELSGSYSGEVKVTGSTGRLILLIREGQTVYFNNFTLVTDNIDGTTTTITNGTTKAPKIDIYAGSGATIDTSNNCLFTAYFIMPDAVFDEFRMGKQGVTYNDGNGQTTLIQQVAVVGSVLCKEFKCLNNATGIAFLDKNSGASTPGEPHLVVQASQYTRK